MWYGTIWFYIIFYYLFSKKSLFFSKLIHLDPLFSYCWPPNLLLLPNYKVLFVYLFPFPFVALQTRCPDSWEVHQKGMYSLGSGLVHLNLLLTWILWILYCFMPMVNLWFSSQCKPDLKVPGLYVVDSIIRQSRHQFGVEKDVFAPRFLKNFTDTFNNLYLCSEDDKVRKLSVYELFVKGVAPNPCSTAHSS